MLGNSELIDRLRAWARRYEPRSQERTLMLSAAAALEGQEADIEAEITRRMTEKAGPVTPEVVEGAMGGAKLLPWMRKKLGGQ